MKHWIPQLEEARLVLHHSGRGKHVGSFGYYHAALIKQFPDTCKVIDSVRWGFPSPAQGYNVVKIDRGSHRLSFLLYQDFTAAFPALRLSVSCRMDDGGSRITNYEQRANPPILHRKELLLPKEHPLVRDGELLTARLEELGAFEGKRKIGTRDGWNARLRQLGLMLVDDQLVMK